MQLQDQIIASFLGGVSEEQLRPNAQERQRSMSKSLGRWPVSCAAFYSVLIRLLLLMFSLIVLAAMLH